MVHFCTNFNKFSKYLFYSDEGTSKSTFYMYIETVSSSDEKCLRKLFLICCEIRNMYMADDPLYQRFECSARIVVLLVGRNKFIFNTVVLLYDKNCKK